MTAPNDGKLCKQNVPNPEGHAVYRPCYRNLGHQGSHSTSRDVDPTPPQGEEQAPRTCASTGDSQPPAASFEDVRSWVEILWAGHPPGQRRFTVDMLREAVEDWNFANQVAHMLGRLPDLFAATEAERQRSAEEIERLTEAKKACAESGIAWAKRAEAAERDRNTAREEIERLKSTIEDQASRIEFMLVQFQDFRDGRDAALTKVKKHEEEIDLLWEVQKRLTAELSAARAALEDLQGVLDDKRRLRGEG